MNHKIARWMIILICAPLAALGIHYFLRSLGVPLYRDFYGLLLSVELVLLTVSGGLFLNVKKLAPKDVFHQFFRNKFVVFLCLFVLITLLLWLVSGKEPEEQPPTPPASPSSSGENNPGGKKNPPQEEPPMQIPFCSLSEWEEDPFLLDLDKYCSRHVEGNDISKQVLGLLNQCLSDIEFRGPYPPDDLNGAGSAYASHTAEANVFRRGYDLLHREGILLDYQISMLKDELNERDLADQLYSVSDNKKIMGDICLKLGDIYYKEKNDLNMANEYYKQAFTIFLDAYRTCYAEGADGKMFQLIFQCLTFAGEKLSMLEGMDNQEQKMAPIIIGALTQLQG